MLIAINVGLIRPFGSTARSDLILHKVALERLQLTITERGQLESAENKDIVCRVKARSPNSTIATTIRWVIEDGATVKKGDKLVELDDSGLQAQLQTQKIALDQALANYIQAEKAYEIVESQNRSDLATAKLNEELAVLDLEKYIKGEYIQAMQEIEGRLMIARSDLTMWEERAAWSDRMSRPGRRYVTAAQAQADEARLMSARIAYAKVEEERRVLKDFIGPRTIKDLTGKIEEARRALDRVAAQARAKEVQADADRKAKKSIYEQELVRYAEIEEEIRKCIIYAPQSGLVVYYIPEQSRFGSGSQQSIVAQGEPVREGQKLMRIPDLDKMVVNTRVHEAMISRVRGEVWQKTGFSDAIGAAQLFLPTPVGKLAGRTFFQMSREDLIEEYKEAEQRKVADGQFAHVRVDAYPDRNLLGEVKSVATVASQQDWLSADVKVYQTLVTINEAVPGLKPGMSAEVTIYTDDASENCLTVPVPAILGSVDMGNKRRVYVLTDNGPEPREVVVGLSNDKMAEIVSGLNEGDLVIVNPRVLLTDKEKAQFGDSGPYRYRSPDNGPGKGKGKGKGNKNRPPPERGEPAA
jgi:HlyD family secretion protein